MTIQSEKDVLKFSSDGTLDGAGSLVELNAQGKVPIEVFPTGTVSNQGSTGPTGPQGQTGLAGSGGGNQGPQGATGSSAETLTGPQGQTGPQGFAGQNITGPQGQQGQTGQVGLTGPQGIQGGSTGPQGNQGETGVQGLTGSIGPTGPQGIAITGPQGLQGETGFSTKGPLGVTGVTGVLGVLGPTGFDSPGGSDIDYVAVSGTFGEGDFISVRDAALAGHVNIQVIGDTTETGDIPISSSFSIRINEGVTLDLGLNNIFSYTGSQTLTIEGGSLVYQLTSGSTPAFNPDAGSILQVRDITITNNSSLSSRGLCGQGALRSENLRFICPNISNNGLNFVFGVTNNSFVRNTTIVGGGNNCENALTTTSSLGTLTRIVFENITMEGEFSANFNCISIVDNVIVNGVVFNHDIGTNINGVFTCPTNGITNISNQNCRLIFGASSESRTLVSNIKLGRGTGTTEILITGGGSSNLSLTNVVATDLRFLSLNGNMKFTNVEIDQVTTGVGIASEGGLFQNCTFGNTVEISGPFTATENVFINCFFESIEVESGADRNRFINCFATGVSVTGDDTCFIGCEVNGLFTINAGANRTIVYGTHDGLFTDNGTGTLTNANV